MLERRAGEGGEVVSGGLVGFVSFTELEFRVGPDFHFSLSVAPLSRTGAHTSPDARPNLPIALKLLLFVVRNVRLHSSEARYDKHGNQRGSDDQIVHGGLVSVQLLLTVPVWSDHGDSEIPHAEGRIPLPC